MVNCVVGYCLVHCFLLDVPGVVSLLRCLVRNDLRAGCDGTQDTRAKVALHTCILPYKEGTVWVPLIQRYRVER